MKTVTIEIPDDCEVKIIKKEEKKDEKKEEKKEPVIRTYQDLIDTNTTIKGYYIGTASGIIGIHSILANNNNRNIVASEKVAKSMLAMAMISQLMPYYGGEITDKEWSDKKLKYMIQRVGNRIKSIELSNTYHFLSFHTAYQRNEFLKNNEQLVKDYLMID
jgi:hypothetical protein|nr:MAG TPA: hypothetical protein [Bacteriophage sp.]